MTVTKFITVGTLTMPSSWIALITAFIVAYIAVRFRFGKQPVSLLTDSIFYVVLIWKLSYILTDFSVFLKHPLAIIYFNGGIFGFYFGVVLVAMKTIWELTRGHIGVDGIRSLLTGSILIQVVYQIMMVLLNDGEAVAQLITVVVFVVFFVFYWINSAKRGIGPVQLTLLFMAVHLFVGSFQPGKLFGTPLVLTIIIGVFFICIFSWQQRTDYGTEEQV